MPVPVVNPQNGDDLTAQSITTNVTDRLVSWAGVHEIGGTTNGAVRHVNDQIDAHALPETTTPTQTPANQHLFNDSTYATLSGLLGAYAGSGFIAKALAATADITYKNLVALLRGHSHADATHGGQLAQANTHQAADTDATTGSLHHTIGTGATQAAAGDHTHANMEVTTNKGAANGYAGLNGSGVLPTTVLPTSTSVTAAAWTVGAATNATTAAGVSAGAIDNTALAANAVTSAKILDGTIVSADIAAGTITGGNIAATTITAGNIVANTITAAQIAPATITGGNIAGTTITGSNLVNHTITNTQIAPNTITATEMANLSVGTAALNDLGVTTGKLADQAVTNAKIADYSIAMTKFLEGAITPVGGMVVNVAPLHKWNANGSAIFWQGGNIDLTNYVPTNSSSSVFILLMINATSTLRAKSGIATTSPLTDTDRPTADINNTPVGYVVLSTSQTVITTANIQPWIGLGGFPGAAVSGGSPVGHRHNQLPENQITGDALSEGWAAPTASPSLSILINPLHYRLASGIAAFKSQTTFGPFATPSSGFRTYGVYLDPTTGNYAMTSASDNGVYPPVYPAFSGNQRSICYIHLTSTSANIKAGDDGAGGGWIEDARVWLAGSGPNTTPVGVTDGGSGQYAFAFSGLLMAGVGSTTAPFTEVPASISVTQGLAIAPTLTPGAADHSLVSVGGTVAMGTSSMTNSVAFDVLPATRTGSSGNATNAYSLRATGPTYATGVNAAGYFKTGAAAGIAAIFDTVVSPTGDINQYRANGAIVGRVTANGSMTAGGAHAAAATSHIVTQSTATIGQIIDSPVSQTARLQSWRVNGTEVAGVAPGGAIITSGPTGGVSLGDRSSAHSTLLYRTGNTVQNYDDTNGGTWTYDSTNGLTVQAAYTAISYVNSWTTASGFAALAKRQSKPDGTVFVNGGITGGAGVTVVGDVGGGYPTRAGMYAASYNATTAAMGANYTSGSSLIETLSGATSSLSVNYIYQN